MKFLVEQDNSVVVLSLKEEKLDAQIAGDLKAEFLILCQPNIEALIVNLENVSFCDSSGLGALLLAKRLMNEHGGVVALASIHENIERLLSISQIKNQFLCYGDIVEAMEDFRQIEGDDDDDY